MQSRPVNQFHQSIHHWREDRATYFVTFSKQLDSREFQPVERDLIQQVMLDHHQVRYHLWAWVVMNDHIHAVLTPLDEYTVEKIIHTW